MDDNRLTHPSSLLSDLARDWTKSYYTQFATLIGLMLDPPIHNRPFADKRDKVGIDGVPYAEVENQNIYYRYSWR